MGLYDFCFILSSGFGLGLGFYPPARWDVRRHIHACDRTARSGCHLYSHSRLALIP